MLGRRPGVKRAPLFDPRVVVWHPFGQAGGVGPPLPHPGACLPGEGPWSSDGTLGGPQAIGSSRYSGAVPFAEY
jgi:hypothetical protein